MKKKIYKAFDVMGYTGAAGYGAVIMWLGLKVIKWSFSELEGVFKD